LGVSESPQGGRLYRTRKANHPEATIAPSRKSRDAERFAFANQPLGGILESSAIPASAPGATGLAGWQVFTLLLSVLAIFTAADALFMGSLGWLSVIPFILLSLGLATRTRVADGWANWTAPPLAFAAMTILNALLSGEDFGGPILTVFAGLLLGLSDNMWSILVTTALSWVIARRRYVRFKTEVQRQRRLSQRSTF